MTGPVEKRRWRARTPRPVGISDAPCEREASWSAERQFRLGRQTAAFDQFEGFCLTPAERVGHGFKPELAGSRTAPCPDDSKNRSAFKSDVCSKHESAPALKWLKSGFSPCAKPPKRSNLPHTLIRTTIRDESLT
jgi:hypothetical protein